MIESGESLYLMSVSLSTSSGERISAAPLWRICGKTNPVEFAEWVVNQTLQWVDVVQSRVPGRLSNAQLEIIANSTFFVTTNDHRVEYIRTNMSVRELQTMRRDKLQRYVRSEIKPATNTVTVHQN